MRANTKTILQERVAARLAELRRSPRDVSLKAGLGPDAIRTILTGRSRSPRADTLAALADELQCDVGYLIGSIDTPHASEDLRTAESGVVRGVSRMPIAGNVHTRWVSLDSPELTADYPDSDVFSLPQFLPGYQSLRRVLDSSCDLVAPAGSFLHVLALTAETLDIQDRDLVIVAQQRVDAGDEGEVRNTCMEVRKYPNGLTILRAPTSVPSLQEELVFEKQPPGAIMGWKMIRSGHAIWIEALVLRAVIHFGGPSVEQSLGA